MGQVLHGSATTTHAIRAAIQRSTAPLKELAAQYGLNQKTVAKWRKRAFVHDAAMGPKVVRSTVLTTEEEAAVVAFRRHTLLPLDDCLYALQATIPHGTSNLSQIFASPFPVMPKSSAKRLIGFCHTAAYNSSRVTRLAFCSIITAIFVESSIQGYEQHSKMTRRLAAVQNVGKRDGRDQPKREREAFARSYR